MKGRFLKSKETYLLLCLGLVSVSIFLYYLSNNYNINYYDETGYISLANKIIHEGLFSVVEPLRTYLYPLIISAVYYVVSENIIYTKIIISIFQYSVYILTILTISKYCYSMTNSKKASYFVLLLGAINPYLIQSTTLFLTDILSACFVVLAILFALNENKSRYYVIAIILLYSSVMIRPSAAIFIVITFLLVIYRYIKYKDINLFKISSLSVILLIIFIPQLYNNVVHFQDWTPLIHENLFSSQSTWATKYLKYGTSVIPLEDPGVYYNNPLDLGNINMFTLMFKNFFAFSFTFLFHIFGVLDWGYIDAYIKNFYDYSRILGSLFLYICWFFIALGVLKFSELLKDKRMKSQLNGLLFTCLLYMLFIGLTCIESRFGYPIFLLLMPFAAISFNWMHTKYNKKCVYKMIIIVLVFCTVCFGLSFWLDSKTSRIDWIKYIKGEQVEVVTQTELILDEEIKWEFVGSYSGYKIVQFNPPQGLPEKSNSIILYKNNTMIYSDDSFITGDRFSYRYWENPKHFVISISNKDSGWTKEHTPSIEEVNNYFKQNKYIINY